MEAFMLEVFTVIAALCQMQSSAPIPTVDRAQLSCQQYYVRCFKAERGNVDDRIEKCIMTRDARLKRN
jgi:hypothetical protein